MRQSGVAPASCASLRATSNMIRDPKLCPNRTNGLSRSPIEIRAWRANGVATESGGRQTRKGSIDKHKPCVYCCLFVRCCLFLPRRTLCKEKGIMLSNIKHRAQRLKTASFVVLPLTRAQRPEIKPIGQIPRHHAVETCVSRDFANTFQVIAGTNNIVHQNKTAATTIHTPVALTGITTDVSQYSV